MDPKKTVKLVNLSDCVKIKILFDPKIFFWKLRGKEKDIYLKMQHYRIMHNYCLIFIVYSSIHCGILNFCYTFFFILKSAECFFFLIPFWLLTSTFKSKFRAGREMLLKCILDVVSAVLCF